jgi:hypothetical protein
MTRNDDWSPDEALGTEVFEQGDEARDDDVRVDASLLEEIEQDPSLDPGLQVDERELEEAGAELDDPDLLVSLEGGGDDPDGGGEPTPGAAIRGEDDPGWELDTPLTRGEGSDPELTD